MAQRVERQGDSRRGTEPAEEAYLGLVGDRLRQARAQRGLSRKNLSIVSGVSERYLAEMERGAGNASLLVVRRLAAAMDMKVSDLVAEAPGHDAELQQAVRLLERLSGPDLAATCAWLERRFEPSPVGLAHNRIAFVGMNGAGKKTLGRALAQAMRAPCILLDAEVERKCGKPLIQFLATRGQAAVEQLELECLSETLAGHSRCVIVTGAAFVTSARAYDMLRANTFVIWLQATSELHAARAAAQGGRSRPSTIGETRAMLLSRQDLYARADATLDTSAITEPEALEQLMALAALRV